MNTMNYFFRDHVFILFLFCKVILKCSSVLTTQNTKRVQEHFINNMQCVCSADPLLVVTTISLWIPGAPTRVQRHGEHVNDRHSEDLTTSLKPLKVTCLPSHLSHRCLYCFSSQQLRGLYCAVARLGPRSTNLPCPNHNRKMVTRAIPTHS